MDRMFVEAVPAAATSPEKQRTGNRFPAEMLFGIPPGAAHARRLFASPLPRRPAGAAAANPCSRARAAGKDMPFRDLIEKEFKHVTMTKVVPAAVEAIRAAEESEACGGRAQPMAIRAAVKKAPAKKPAAKKPAAKKAAPKRATAAKKAAPKRAAAAKKPAVKKTAAAKKPAAKKTAAKPVAKKPAAKKATAAKKPAVRRPRKAAAAAPPPPAPDAPTT